MSLNKGITEPQIAVHDTVRLLELRFVYRRSCRGIRSISLGFCTDGARARNLVDKKASIFRCHTVGNISKIVGYRVFLGSIITVNLQESVGGRIELQASAADEHSMVYIRHLNEIFGFGFRFAEPCRIGFHHNTTVRVENAVIGVCLIRRIR